MIWVKIILLFAAVVSPSDITSDAFGGRKLRTKSHTHSDIVKGKEIRNRRCWFDDFLTAAGKTGNILCCCHQHRPSSGRYCAFSFPEDLHLQTHIAAAVAAFVPSHQGAAVSLMSPCHMDLLTASQG